MRRQRWVGGPAGIYWNGIYSAARPIITNGEPQNTALLDWHQPPWSVACGRTMLFPSPPVTRCVADQAHY